MRSELPSQQESLGRALYVLALRFLRACEVTCMVWEWWLLGKVKRLKIRAIAICWYEFANQAERTEERLLNSEAMLPSTKQAIEEAHREALAQMKRKILDDR